MLKLLKPKIVLLTSSNSHEPTMSKQSVTIADIYDTYKLVIPIIAVLHMHQVFCLH
jgi:hypothetical protein